MPRICAVIRGADPWVEMDAYGRAKEEWRTRFLPLPNGIPSHDTFARVLARLKPHELQRCFLNWIPAVSELTHGEVVAIDGETLRRSFDQAAGKGVMLQTLLSPCCWYSSSHGFSVASGSEGIGHFACMESALRAT